MLKVTAALQMFSSAASCFVLLYTNDSSITIPLSSRSLSLSFLCSSKRRKWIIWAVLESLRAFPLSLTVSAVLDGLKHTRTHRKMPRTTVKKNWCKVHHSQQPLHFFLWLHPIFPSFPSIFSFLLFCFCSSCNWSFLSRLCLSAIPLLL